MEELEKVIDTNYSKLSKNQILQISLDVCYKLMKEKSELLQSNLNVWDEETILFNTKRIDWYTNINLGLLEFSSADRNSDTLLEAKSSISLLLMYIQEETENEFIETDLVNQQRIINKVYIPHLLLKWSLNNL